MTQRKSKTTQAPADVIERMATAYLAAENVKAARKPLGPADAAAVLYPMIGLGEVERTAVIGLSRRGTIVASEIVAVGSDGYTIVDAKTILRWALTRPVVVHRIILAHNHPSGDPKPSPQDRDVTQRMITAGRTVGVEIADHLILTPDPAVWHSMAMQGDVFFSAPLREVGIAG